MSQIVRGETKMRWFNYRIHDINHDRLKYSHQLWVWSELEIAAQDKMNTWKEYFQAIKEKVINKSPSQVTRMCNNSDKSILNLVTQRYSADYVSFYYLN